MNFLLIGLGSMGKRRIRNLHYLGHHDILAFDIRGDRLLEAKSSYGIATLDSLNSLDWNKITHVIVSTPPDQHADYALEALQEINTCSLKQVLLMINMKI